MDFSTRAKALYDKGNFTQKELAELCGVSESMISRYLSGTVTPKEDIARRILEVMGDEPPKISVEGGKDLKTAIALIEKVYDARIEDLWRNVAALQNEVRTEKREKWIFIVLFLLAAGVLALLFYVDLTNGHVGWYRY